MSIEIFDVFNKTSFLNINRISKFLHEHLADFKSKKHLISKSLRYATKEISGLGGYTSKMKEMMNLLVLLLLTKLT